MEAGRQGGMGGMGDEILPANCQLPTANCELLLHKPLFLLQFLYEEPNSPGAGFGIQGGFDPADLFLLIRIGKAFEEFLCYRIGF